MLFEGFLLEFFADTPLAILAEPSGFFLCVAREMVSINSPFARKRVQVLLLKIHAGHRGL
jgi:hypothetical protein